MRSSGRLAGDGVAEPLHEAFEPGDAFAEGRDVLMHPIVRQISLLAELNARNWAVRSNLASSARSPCYIDPVYSGKAS